MSIINNTKPKTAGERIPALEKLLTEKRAGFRNAPKFELEKLPELETLANELEDLKTRDSKEQTLKEKCWRKFSDSFITREEFDFLWTNGGIREEALRASVDIDSMVREVGKTPMYSTF